MLQDRGQLVELYNPQGAESFAANSGCTVALQPNSPETAEWLSNYSGREDGITITASDDPHGGPARVNVGWREERVWSPDKIRELPEFHGLVWKAGASRPTPVYLPPYWEIRACRRVARPDPYHLGSNVGHAHRVVRSIVRVATGAALAAAAIAGLIMMMQSNSFGVNAHAPVLPPFVTAWFQN